MFNYYNFNDVEFEELCKDVMARMLSSELKPRICVYGKSTLSKI